MPVTHRLAFAVPASLITLGLLALLGFSLARQGESSAGVGVNQIGMSSAFRVRPAPDLEITTFDGKTVRLSDLRGQVVVLNFWASWCPPCRQEGPVLERTWQAYRDRGVVLVGVATWDTEQGSRAFLRELSATYPNGADPSAEAAIAYGVAGLPETFFVDRDGQIVRRWIGPVTDSELSETLERLLQ